MEVKEGFIGRFMSSAISFISEDYPLWVGDEWQEVK